VGDSLCLRSAFSLQAWQSNPLARHITIRPSPPRVNADASPVNSRADTADRRSGVQDGLPLVRIVRREFGAKRQQIRMSPFLRNSSRIPAEPAQEWRRHAAGIDKQSDRPFRRLAAGERRSPMRILCWIRGHRWGKEVRLSDIRRVQVAWDELVSESPGVTTHRRHPVVGYRCIQAKTCTVCGLEVEDRVLLLPGREQLEPLLPSSAIERIATGEFVYRFTTERVDALVVNPSTWALLQSQEHPEAPPMIPPRPGEPSVEVSCKCPI
jgi:hypothetical protein